MPIHRRPGLDASRLDGVLSLDLDRGVAGIDLAHAPRRRHRRVRGVGRGRALPRVAERDRRDTLIELERFDDAHGSDRLASFVWERLEGGADGEVVNQLFEATGELGLNVVEHAGSPAGGLVAAQRYKAGMPEERIIVAVGDVGVGIRESLRPRYGDMTEGEAIRRAIQWHVSRIPDEGRGQGLPGVVDGVRGLDGVVWIRSGAVSRMITRRRETVSEVSRLQGTIVGARLPCRPGR
jgi:hypothetical protein